MRDNIGYAIFKKTDTFVIDANGMLEQLKLADNIFVTNIPELKVGEKRICFQRIASNRLKSSIKDAILVTSIIRVEKNNSEGIIGSAIIFKAFQVNEQKIIDGVAYLLNQLKRNFEDEYNLSDTNLGVILPSVNGNFNIFKEEYLQQITSKQNVKCVDTTSLEKGELAKTLHHFYTHPALNHITHLLVVSKHTPAVAFMQNGFEKITIQQLTTPSNNQPEKIALATSYQKENTALKTKLTNTEAEKENALTNKKKYGLFAIISLIVAIIFGVLYFTKTSENNINDFASATGNLYPAKEQIYISHHNYNVNVRSSPIYDEDNDNVKAVLSDGDEVTLLGFDKQTLWAKIRFNENSEVGFVSNKLISKKIMRDRVEKIQRKAKIKNLYYDIPIYNSPKEIGESDVYKDKFQYLRRNHNIYVKSKDLKLNSYSIMYEKNGKILHGYIQREYFEYQ
ncbi:SH3 domain-containing protein [Kordia sp.]|uniref:SH3 domain-containing protein n=1 Tax=Kordia sp. TaxID=1965332 RepID=UPI003B5C48BE